jgi:hypothetical protein
MTARLPWMSALTTGYDNAWPKSHAERTWRTAQEAGAVFPNAENHPADGTYLAPDHLRLDVHARGQIRLFATTMAPVARSHPSLRRQFAFKRI